MTRNEFKIKWEYGFGRESYELSSGDIVVVKKKLLVIIMTENNFRN